MQADQDIGVVPGGVTVDFERWQAEAQGFSASCWIGAEHRDLEGHFPGFPLLPAVSQLGLVLKLLGAGLGAPVRLVRLERAKFSAMVRPGTRLALTVTLPPPAEGVITVQARWRMVADDVVYSSGILVFLPS